MAVINSSSDAPHTVQVHVDAGVTETQQFVFVLCLIIQPNTNSLFGTNYQIEYEENIWYSPRNIITTHAQ